MSWSQESESAIAGDDEAPELYSFHYLPPPLCYENQQWIDENVGTTGSTAYSGQSRRTRLHIRKGSGSTIAGDGEASELYYSLSEYDQMLASLDYENEQWTDDDEGTKVSTSNSGQSRRAGWQECESAIAGDDKVPELYCSLQTEYGQVLPSLDYENQPWIDDNEPPSLDDENQQWIDDSEGAIGLTTYSGQPRGTRWHDRQVSEYENQQAIEKIRGRIISTKASPQLPEQGRRAIWSQQELKYENRGGMEHVQGTIRSTQGGMQLHEDGYQQGIEYIQPGTRSRRPDVHTLENEDHQGIEYIQECRRSRRPVPRVVECQDQQGIEYIQTCSRSERPDPQFVLEYQDEQGIEHIQGGSRSERPEPQVLDYEDRQGINYIQRSMRSKQPDPQLLKYQDQQGIEYIQVSSRLERPDLQVLYYEDQIQGSRRSKQILNYEDQQGIMYIQGSRTSKRPDRRILDFEVQQEKKFNRWLKFFSQGADLK